MEPSHELHAVVARNIRALLDERRRFEERKTRQQRVADRITGFTGDMRFVYLHAALFGGWILLNSGVVPGVKAWDPFPFVMLAMAASVEAIFLSTFVLISQNRMQELADRRADLDLQINLLAEHEVTKLLGVVDAIAQKLGVAQLERRELDALMEQVKPDMVLREIDQQADEEPAAPSSHPAPASR